MKQTRDMTIKEIVDQYLNEYHNYASPEQREQVLKSVEFAVGFSFDDVIEDALNGVKFVK